LLISVLIDLPYSGNTGLLAELGHAAQETKKSGTETPDLRTDLEQKFY
jgi:hypothetical protein